VTTAGFTIHFIIYKNLIVSRGCNSSCFPKKICETVAPIPSLSSTSWGEVQFFLLFISIPLFPCRSEDTMDFIVIDALWPDQAHGSSFSTSLLKAMHICSPMYREKINFFPIWSTEKQAILIARLCTNDWSYTPAHHHGLLRWTISWYISISNWIINAEQYYMIYSTSVLSLIYFILVPVNS
jgi:hypothetical protein